MSKRLAHALGWLLMLIVWNGYTHAQETDGGTSPPDRAIPQAETQGDIRGEGMTAVIQADLGQILDQPSIFSTIQAKVGKGTAMAVLEKQGEWYFVRLGDGRTGWAHQSIVVVSRSDPAASPKPSDSRADKPQEKEKTPSGTEKRPLKTEMVIESGKELMNVNFLNVDIREALSALAMEREINIATAQNVSGNISVHLYDVTLEKALNAITLAGGLNYYKQGDLYFVYKPKDTKDPQAERLQMRVYKLMYGEIEKIQEILTAFPGIRVLKIHEPSRTIVVEDTPENISKVEKIIKYWDRMPKQVLIEAKILEVTLTDDMTFGVNWEGILGNAGNARIGTGGFSTSTLPTAEPPVSPVPLTGTGIFGNFISSVGTQRQFAMALDLLQTKTRVNTLSTPKILAVHGRPAKVLVGGQQGYKVTTTNIGVATETVQFIDTGTILEITPYIDDDNNVLLKVQPSINSAKIEQGVPVVSSTLVTTTLMARNGETVFIGGLIQDSTSKTRDMIPCLGGIPVLGAVFGRTVSNLGKTELVVLITPNILNAELIRVNHESIERVGGMEKEFKKQPSPEYERIFDFTMPVK